MTQPFPTGISSSLGTAPGVRAFDSARSAVASPHTSRAAPRFPWLSLLAPVVISILMLVIFRSPFALIIGFLGPLMAFSSWWEARRNHRRAAAEDVASAEAGVRERHALHQRQEREFRREALARYPSVDEWMANPLWRPNTGGQPEGGQPGGGQPVGGQPGGPGAPLLRVGLDRIDHSGQSISGLPLVVDLVGGVAVVGDGLEAGAVYRAVVIQALALWSSQDPERDVHLVWPIDSEGSLPGEPPDSLELPGMENVALGVFATSGVSGVRCERVARQSDVHPQVHTVVVVSGTGQAQVYRDGRRIDQALRPDVLGAPAALWALRRMAQWRRVETPLHRKAGSPDDRSGLWFSLDDQHSHNLATDGPHALVWGKTGRGKTILLQRLLLDAARRYTPEQFSCVMIDFKGGAGALGLQGLDHLAGVLTDLEPDSLRRVHTGLVSEIARRETLLAAHSVSDISQLPPEVICPRSIIAIDEVALLVQREPRFVELLADIAARGRSLGLHVVISGQRMTSQVPQGVIVNAGLRFCVGVTDPMEAREYLPGVPEADIRRLSATPPGTTLGLTLGDTPYTSRVQALGPPKSFGSPAARLWSESLPDVVAPVEGELGLVELAAEQCLAPWRADDIGHGVVVLVGDVGSGVGEAMARFVECQKVSTPTIFLPQEPAALLDALGIVIDRARMRNIDGASDLEGAPFGGGDQHPMQLCAPRIDRVWGECSEQVQALIAERIAAAGEALADLPQPGRLVVSSRPGCGIVRRVVRGGAELITLRVSQLDYLDQWGIDRRSFSPHAPPGRGLWRNHPIHWARPEGGLLPGDNPVSQESPWARPTLDEVVTRQRGGVLVMAENPDATAEAEANQARVDHAGWSLAPPHHVFSGGGVDGALSGPGVILRGLSPTQMRAVVGHELAPLVPAPHAHAWWVRAHSVRLIDWE